MVPKFLNIGEAYFFINRYILKHGERIPIDRGSYEGVLERIQIPFVSFEITHPLDWGWLAEKSFPLPIDSEKINDYFINYLISDKKSENEEYTYGERILECGQLYENIKRLEQGFTNQAAIAISKPKDIMLQDPPCWREISFNRAKDTINMAIFARSWDCFNALPLNLSGMAKLLEFVAGFVEDVKPGRLFVAASNPHIYSDMEDIVKEYTFPGRGS